MSTEHIDQAKQVRPGEELDLAAVQDFLLRSIPDATGELSIEQFPGGASNLTYLIRLGDRDLVLRRPPYGAKIKSAHDMGREFRVLSALSSHYDKVPTPLAYTEDESIIGCPFYVMERVHGVILRGRGGFMESLSAEQVHDIAEGLIDTFVELHGLDYEVVGLTDLGRPEGYVGRQVSGWTKRYFNAKTDEHDTIESTAAWLADHQPKESGVSVVHNDFKHDNVVLDADDLSQVKAILDWEMCTIGDPLMDLGTSLAYWMNPEDPPLFRDNFANPSTLVGNPSRSQWIEMYEGKCGRAVDHPVFYYVYGLFKIAVIVQQIYARYKAGHTKDPRFKNFNIVVAGFGQMASQAIAKNRIDDLF
ncbi:MAG: phosphotransferase family protein [Bacteroidota bacterium]